MTEQQLAEIEALAITATATIWCRDDSLSLLAQQAGLTRALVAEIRRLRAALGHYGDPDHWGSAVGRYPHQVVYFSRDNDGYAVARVALALDTATEAP